MPTHRLPRADRGALAYKLLDRLAAAAPGESGAPGSFVSIEGERSEAYQLGLLDFLAAFGMIEQSDDGLCARPVSPLAGWALRIVCDIFDHGSPLVADWHSSGRTATAELRHPFARATDLLAALDRRRYELLPAAAPVREISASVGILPRNGPEGQLQFLLVYDADALSWQLPGGRPAPDDATASDTLRRELCEELALRPCDIARLTLIDLFPTLLHTRESPTFGPRSRIAFTPFLVLGAQDLPADGGGLRWFGELAIRAGRADDGARIAVEPLVFLLDRPELNLRQLMLDHGPAGRV